MAAPAFIAAAPGTVVNETSIAVVIPDAGAGVVAGQRALLVLVDSPSPISATPTGWTLVDDTEATPFGSSGRSYVWRTVIGSTADVDPGDTVTVTLQGSSRAALAVVVYEAADIEAQSDLINGGASGTAAVATPKTSIADEARVIHIYPCRRNGTAITWTPDAATTERVDACSLAGSGANATILIADEIQSVPGTTTARTATPTAEVTWSAIVIALSVAVARPVADAGPNQTVAADATGVQLAGTPTAGTGPGGPYTNTWRIVSDTTGGAVLSATNVEDPTLNVGSNAGTVVCGYTATDSAAVPSLEDTVTITVVGAGSTAFPIADGIVTGWLEQPDDGSPLASALADTSDSTYVYYVDPAGNVVIEFPLSDLEEFEGADTLTAFVRPSMFQGTSGSITTIIKDGASTVIASFGPDNWATDSIVQQFDHPLSATEKDAVAVATDLRMRWEGTVT